MDCFPRSSLTALQRELLDAFFEREQRFFLTGGAALAGFYFGHRTTDDLDLFTLPGIDLEQGAHVLASVVGACHATIEPVTTYPDFRRVLVRRGDERCLVDLVIDRAAVIDTEKQRFASIRVDTLREMTANKICALIGRSQVKDLVDLKTLLSAGMDLVRAFTDAQRKDGGADPATLAWLLNQLTISPEARLPGGVDPAEMNAFVPAPAALT